MRFASVPRLLASLVGVVALLAAALVPLRAAPTFVSDEVLRADLVARLDERLALMPEVAAHKFRAGTPIADPAREAAVIASAVTAAQVYRLEPEPLRAVYQLQIALARIVQEAWHAHWRATGTAPAPARDLASALRPELDRQNTRFLQAAALAVPMLASASVDTVTASLAPLARHRGITSTHLGDLARALAALRLSGPPTLASVRAAGVLRVGTTGDYAPFSDDRGGTLAGLDIDLAADFAQSLGVAVLFVRTTWPTLLADLAAQRFDVALSGISITDERRRTAAFSVPYLHDGKTPIARRADADRFATLEAIDRPEVRVIVNPGGTNERFARDHLRRARLIVHPDNRTIFAEIVAGRADVMITDGIEVRLRERLHPELRGTRTEPFTRAGKALLLPAGSDLAAIADAWLHPQIDDGRLAARLDSALAAAAR